MKNRYKILIAFVAILGISCNGDDVENRPVIQAVMAPEMIAPESGKQFVLVEKDASKEVDKFVWTAAKYSDNVVIEYKLLIDKKGGDFTAAKTVTTTNNIAQAAVLVKNLNQTAIDLGAEPDVAALYDIKVMSTVSGSVSMLSETPITISITPYLGNIAYPFEDWYLVGDATVSGWDNNKGNQILFRNATDDKEYKFTGFFKAGAFKAIKNLGSWTPMYGGENGTLAYRKTESDPDPASFVIAADGYYAFTMNLRTLKYTLVPYDAAAAKIYPTIGIIGDSTPGGWSTSTAMTKSTFDPHIWYLGVTALKDGSLKFRANNAWDDDWGGTTAFSGTNGYKGGNIPVEKSKYLIYFDDLDGSYLLVPNQE